MPGGQELKYFILFSEKTAFWKLQDLFPECFLYRESSPQIDPLMCLSVENSCHHNHNCMETLVKRVHVLFQEVLPAVEVLVLYFKRWDDSRFGAGVFWRDLRAPRVISINKWAFKYVQGRGQIFSFKPNSSFFLGSNVAPPTPEEAIPES